MTSLVGISFGNAKQWAASVKKHGDKVVARAAQAMWKAAEITMTEIKAEHVPVVTGTLRNSGFVMLPVISEGSVSVIMGFGGMAADYAYEVHENPRAGKTATGSQVGGWHYLSDPVEALRPKLAAQIAAIMKTGGQ